MLLSAQPVPKTIEDLGQEVGEDTLLARLEHQRAVQEEAIRNYKTDTLVIGVPKPTPAHSEGSDDDGDLEDSSYQSYNDNDEFEEEEDEAEDAQQQQQ